MEATLQKDPPFAEGPASPPRWRAQFHIRPRHRPPSFRQPTRKVPTLASRDTNPFTSVAKRTLGSGIPLFSKISLVYPESLNRLLDPWQCRFLMEFPIPVNIGSDGWGTKMMNRIAAKCRMYGKIGHCWLLRSGFSEGVSLVSGARITAPIAVACSRKFWFDFLCKQ